MVSKNQTMTRLILCTGLWLTLVSCTQTIEIQEFDKNAWKRDKLGCEGERDQLSISLFTQKQQLFDAHPRAIKKLLGSPNKTELYSRNQRFFVYYISTRSPCPGDSTGNEGATLNIRFGALNKVNEVYVVE
jgi:hypothetical protein